MTMTVAADTRGLCKLIGVLGGLHAWNEDAVHDAFVYVLGLREANTIRLAETAGHPELLHPGRETGKVELLLLAKICTTKLEPGELLRICARLLMDQLEKQASAEE